MEPDDETDATADDHKSSHAALLVLFAWLLARTRDTLTEDVTAYLSSAISLSILSDRLVTALGSAHTKAAVLGRQLAVGGSSAVTDADRSFAAVIVAGQVEYLSGLLHDLASKRYVDAAGNVDARSGLLAIRLAMYAMALRTTADQSWVVALPDDTMVNWVTTARESCDGCLRMEAGSPYIASNLETFPGDEECGPMCRCFLQIVGNTTGFILPDL